MSNNGVPTDQASKGSDRVLSIKEDDNNYNALKKNHYRLQLAKGVMKDGQRTSTVTSVPPCKVGSGSYREYSCLQPRLVIPGS